MATRLRRQSSILALGIPQDPRILAALSIAGLVPLFAVAAANVGGQAVLWENGHWTLASAAAVILAASHVRGTTGATRRVRLLAAAGLASYFAGAVVWDLQIAAGAYLVPAPSDALFLAIAVPFVAALLIHARRAMSRAELVALALDGATVTLTVAAAVFFIYEPIATGTNPAFGVILLAYPTVFLGLASFTTLAALTPSAPTRATGPLLAAAGLAVTGVTWVIWLAAAAVAFPVAGSPLNALSSIAIIIVGAGIATWEVPDGARQVSEAHTARPTLFAGLPVIAVLVAAAFVVGHSSGLDTGELHLVDISAWAVIAVAVLRQTLLLRERTWFVTERALLVDSLRESQRDLEEAQRIAHVGSWTLDPATGKATWSPEMYRILGLEPDGPPIDLPDISRLFTPRSVSDVTAAVDRAIARGEPWHLDLELARPDGPRGWVTSNGVVERDPSGSVVRIRGTMQDVTEQRRLEAELRQAQRLEVVGQLAGGIAHDFNNLLTVIRGYAELAQRSLASDDRARTDVAQVVLAADRAAELTRQLLAFSRRQVLQPRVIDPAEVVTGIAPMLRRLLGEHVELVIHATPGPGRIKVDPSQYEQVIVNLAVNARDAMPNGGTLTIETSNVELDATHAAAHAEALPGSYVALVVSDTGTGMDESTRAHIFEPFFTTKEPGKGTGMGLATVYGIVKQSGGSIYVYSEPGHGTSFKIYLPRVKEDPVLPANDAPPAGAPTGSEVILLVEDEEAVRTFAARILEGQGYTVLQAANGGEALALAAARAGRIDLLITDVIMPGLQGHQLAAQLAAERPELRVLYVSGFTETSVIHLGVAKDGVSFLPKPFTGEALGRAARQALDGDA